MKYTTPTILLIDSAFEAIRGAKGEPFPGDLINPLVAPYMHTQNAYEADE